MINNQPVEKATHREDGALEIFEAFETIQGEGPLVGSPSVFVRLSGCNLDCPCCDTDYTSKRKVTSVVEAVELVKSKRESGLVVLTGGEPLRQNVEPFVRALLQANYVVQIESNGTVFQPLPFDHKNFLIVCSPKTGINYKLKPFITAYKYVVQVGNISEDDGLPITTLGNTCKVGRPGKDNKAPIYLQPLDEGSPEANRDNTEAAIQSCLLFGYKLCLQLHKIVGLP